ncbi:hypothetical protein [Microbacterium sp. XT11]|uniref:hypothetical protein n=1 Tax=Microbacterium sp. XT11 TaxID=367477 RepID=UPI000834CC01|nr:hypothetical protein [Microbacterium sp. XT11]
MAFRLIKPASRVWLDSAGSADALVSDADRAVTALRRDYERWSRLGGGILAFTVTAAALFVGSAAWAFLFGPWLRDTATIATAIIAPLVAAAGIFVLWRLHRSGRRLAGAAAWWMRLPYRTGARPRPVRGYVLARTIYLEPALLARSLTMGCALLLLILGVAGFVRGLVVMEQEPSVTIALATLSAISAACFCGQLGGVARIGAGASEADPIWARTRDAFRDR